MDRTVENITLGKYEDKGSPGDMNIKSRKLAKNMEIWRESLSLRHVGHEENLTSGEYRRRTSTRFSGAACLEPASGKGPESSIANRMELFVGWPTSTL